ncbi:hypothetical protein V6N13_089415 [Hibiscus sabdariffa]|uniref:Uncharacterized protein n=2 Tax=Hibiscus sabdariffa TaxID=183260 RepID=A0ABR2NT88_9ROSI
MIWWCVGNVSSFLCEYGGQRKRWLALVEAGGKKATIPVTASGGKQIPTPFCILFPPLLGLESTDMYKVTRMGMFKDVEY